MFFIIFKELSVAKNFLRPVSAPLTLFWIDLFGSAHGWGEGQKESLPKICQAYPTMIKLGTVMSYPKKIQNIYKSRGTPLSSADIIIFSLEMQI